MYSTGVRNTLAAMRANGAAKLAVISAGPAAPWAEQPSLQRRIALPILQRMFGATYNDMRRMETILFETTQVDWISLRPPRLVNKPAKGSYRIDTRPLAKARSITYGDLAAAMLDATVKTHLRNAMHKLDVHSQAQLVAVALTTGMIELEQHQAAEGSGIDAEA